MKDEADWRVGHVGRDTVYYEERCDGGSRRLELGGEMAVGPPNFVIYFGSRADWNHMPEWARGRRDEIIKRIKTAFPMTSYAYTGEAILDDDDRAFVIQEAGGLSDQECGWFGCAERALKTKRVCVHHCYRGSWQSESAVGDVPRR